MNGFRTTIKSFTSSFFFFRLCCTDVAKERSVWKRLFYLLMFRHSEAHKSDATKCVQPLDIHIYMYIFYPFSRERRREREISITDDHFAS